MPEIIKPSNPTPFLDVLSAAEEIHVDEVIAPPKVTTDGYYTYYVKIKPKASPEAPKEKKTESIPTHTDEFLLKNAEVLLQAEDYLLAKNIYSALLERNIRDSKALMGLGRCLVKLGQNSSARKCFSAVSELYKDPSAMLALAICCSEQEEDEEAISQFEKIATQESLTPVEQFEMYKMWGNSLTRLSNFEGAQEKYQKALEINPSSDILFINLGTLAIQNKAYEEAERHFERALALNPKSARASCGLGLISLEQDCLPLAQKYFLEAQRKEPGNRIAALQLAAIGYVTHDFVVAILALEDALKKNPNDIEVRYALAAIYFTEERWAPAENELKQVLMRDPAHERAGKLMASILEQRRK